MGIFGKLFGGGEPELPALDPASAGAQNLEKFKPQITELVGKINDRYEVVPSGNAAYVFLGKPPGMFGLAWFLEGDKEEHNFKKLMAKRGLPQRKMDNMLNKVRAAYTEAEAVPRVSTQIGGRKVIVLASDSLADKLHTILHSLDE